MLEKRVISARLKKLDEGIAELKALSQAPLKAYLGDRRMQAVVERYLQVTIQACMDIAKHIVARRKIRVPDEEENLFLMLSRAGIIPTQLGIRIKGIVRFRNILVHDTWTLIRRKCIGF